MKKRRQMEVEKKTQEEKNEKANNDTSRTQAAITILKDALAHFHSSTTLFHGLRLISH